MLWQARQGAVSRSQTTVPQPSLPPEQHRQPVAQQKPLEKQQPQLLEKPEHLPVSYTVAVCVHVRRKLPQA